MSTLFSKIASTDLKNKPFIVVDLQSGSYTKTKEGHEKFNLEPNEGDGRYYGYCPPYDNIDIKQLGAKKNDEYVKNVIVIYVTKYQNTNDRIVLAFADNATVYCKGQNKAKNRNLIEEGKNIYCTYTIESDSLRIIGEDDRKFIIRIKDYNSYMFRMQRFYKSKYPSLDNKLITYMEQFLNPVETDDDFEFQTAIQNAEDTVSEEVINACSHEPSYSNGASNSGINKNNRVSKYALHLASYKCEYDGSHTTFKTAKGEPYMEGHHLIPCTVSNADYFWKVFHRNIDCPENIICLCPTCHRRIHFGSDEEKELVVERLYNNRKDRLQNIGIKISLEDLLSLYIKK